MEEKTQLEKLQLPKTIRTNIMTNLIEPVSKEVKKIKLSTDPKIPMEVFGPCKVLEENQHKAWLAGGCVRDLVLGRPPRDWDIVTDAPLDKIKSLFPKHMEVGAAFGVVKLHPIETPEHTVHIDIAIFRKEGEYTDLRHPDRVEPADEFADAGRRDFTVNALYLNPLDSTIYDFVGGHRDIQSKTLRTVGEAQSRFSEDALRILRAIRFSAQLGFKIDRDTQVALKKCAPLVKAISRERIREEVMRILESPRPLLGLDAIAQSGLWETVFGVRRVSLPADLRQLKLTWIPNPLHWLCALAVTGLLGDPQNEPKEMVDRLAEYLKLSNHEKKIISKMICVYTECDKEMIHEKSAGSPLDWIELAQTDKPLMDITKSFIRRARGPSEKEKEHAILLIEQVVRWSFSKSELSALPKAEDLMKEGFKPGAALGKELRDRQWKIFWSKKPVNDSIAQNKMPGK